MISISQAAKQETLLPLSVKQVFCMKTSMVFSNTNRNQKTLVQYNHKKQACFSSGCFIYNQQGKNQRLLNSVLDFGTLIT